MQLGVLCRWHCRLRCGCTVQHAAQVRFVGGIFVSGLPVLQHAAWFRFLGVPLFSSVPVLCRVQLRLTL